MLNNVPQKLESKEINGLNFYKPPFKRTWVISGVDICRYLGYKNPYQQAKQIYQRYKENFTETSYVLKVPTPTQNDTKGGIQADYPLFNKNLQETRCYTRPGCWFFVAKCNIDKANKIIEGLFKRFDKILEIQEEKKTINWQQTRLEGKIARRQFTDGAKLFIEYAKSLGSQHADKYYILFTKTFYSAIFGLKGTVPKNFRDNLTDYELAVLRLIEIATDEELYQLMEKQIPYKDIFKAVKELIIIRANRIIDKEKPKLLG